VAFNDIARAFWLLAISQLDPESSVPLDAKVLPDVAKRFKTSWSRFLAGGKTSYPRNA
jgi:hypothetical protein